MLVNLSCSHPSPSSSFPRFTSSQTPIFYSSLRPKTLSSNPLSPSLLCPLSNLNFLSKNRLFIRHPLGKKLAIRSLAVSRFDFGNFGSVLEAVGILTAIIIVHESGHFLAASLQGIHVSKFAVGFGPILAKFKANNVEYSVRAFPLGGFVGFPDNDPESDIPVDDENLLKNRPILDRVIVISAGVIANIIFAYVIIFVQVLSVGLPVQEALPGVLVPEVRPFSAASRDGLLPGDVILTINGNELSRIGSNAVIEVVDIIKQSPKAKLLLKVERLKEDLEIGVTPDEEFDGTGKIGVQLKPNAKIKKVIAKNIIEAFCYAGVEFRGLSVNVLQSLKRTFLNFAQSANEVSGPVAIIAVGVKVARSNADGLYQFAAIINLNLAVINLLPLPALDGGSLALILIEAARGGKKLPLEVEQRIMSSGIILVILLGLFLIVRDTLKLDFIKDML